MLISIREKSKGWIAWLILIIITVPFALFGINEYFQSSAIVKVAKVNGEDITLTQYRARYDSQVNYLRGQLGNNYNASQIETQAFKESILDNMVDAELLDQFIADNNLRLSDDSLRKEIMSNPAFINETGEFDKEAYKRFAAIRGRSLESIERQIRVDGADQQLRKAVVDSSFVTETERNRLLALQGQSRDVDYFTVNAQQFESELTASDEQLKTYYEANQDQFIEPQRVKLSYVEVNTEALKSDIELDDAAVRQAYDSDIGRYKNAGSRTASHILLSVAESAADDKKAEVKAQADAVLKRAKAGEDFAALAEEFSDDNGSKSRGGDLGTVERGMMVAPFEESVFSLKQDEISDLVETQFGFHIIKLTGLTEESVQSFDDVKKEVKKRELERLAAAKLGSVQDSMATLAFDEPESVQAIADELNVEIQTTDWFSQNTGTGIAAEPKVREAGFSQDVLIDNLNSAVIETNGGSLLVVRLEAMEEEHVKDFVEVAESVKKSTVAELAAAKAKAEGQAHIEALNSGIEVKGLELKKLAEKLAENTDRSLREIANAAFVGAVNESPVFVELTLNNGDYAAYRVNSVTLSEAADATEQQISRIDSGLTSRDGLYAFASFRELLRTDADITLFVESLDAQVYNRQSM